MMKNKYLLLLVLITGFLSCSTEDEPGLPEKEGEDFSNGTFILNEGNYGSGNSSVSYLDPEMENITHTVFQNENEGLPLGDVAQSIGFFEDMAFVVLNVSNTIEVVDRKTFSRIATISTGLENPRFITFSEGKAFVTNWGDGYDPDDDFVRVIDARSFAVEGSVSVAEGPDRVVSENGKVYVAHVGGYNFNNIVSVINAATLNVEETLMVGDQPESLLIQNGNLWVLASGLPAYTQNETAGRISKFDLSDLTSTKEYNFPNITDHPSKLRFDEGSLYYTVGKEVYSLDTSEEQLPDVPLFSMENVAVLYGFEVKDSRIFATSATTDFTGNGRLLIYDLSGNLTGSFETGINPNGIYFNE
ncbi:YncE family protein [Salinimicrobium flavum]|uniref:YncE family protein n=1 Tax=Salinimicrobium flavum TaxID=1737065 RepID=A0ABW5IZA8_9FLAO